MVEFNTDFLFLTKPFVLVTMGDALLSWEFTTTVVVPLFHSKIGTVTTMLAKSLLYYRHLQITDN